MAYDYKAKKKNIAQLVNYMLTKTLSMFEYSGLPETIPRKELERLLQVHGYAFITKAPDGELYAFTGSLGAANKSPYGEPTEITIANPALNFNKTLNLKEDGVLICNDDLRMGLIPYYEKQNTLIVENDINMVVWGYNSRSIKTISAPDDKTRESADAYLRKIVDGDISVIGENPFFDGVRVQSTNTGGGGVTIQAMIEYHQYLTAKMFNEVGLAANFNMKRERLISSELDQSEDSLFPMVYNMMANRISGIEAVNTMFGLEILVDFGSVWAQKNKELVDGNPENNEEPAADSSAGVPDNEPENEQATGAEEVPGEESEADNGNNGDENQPDDETMTGDGNGNGGEGTASDSGTDEITAEQLQVIIDNVEGLYSDEEVQEARAKLQEMEKVNDESE